MSWIRDVYPQTPFRDLVNDKERGWCNPVFYFYDVCKKYFAAETAFFNLSISCIDDDLTTERAADLSFLHEMGNNLSGSGQSSGSTQAPPPSENGNNILFFLV